MLQIIQGIRNTHLITALDQLIEVISSDEFSAYEGFIYIGYPLIKSPEGTKTVPAILISKTLGVIAFDVIPAISNLTEDEAKRSQDFMFVELEAKLKQFPELIKGRKLAFDLEVITYDPFSKISGNELNLHFKTPNDISQFCKEKRIETSLEDKLYNSLQSIIQGAHKLKLPKSRKNVGSSHTMGGIMKELEQETATLDLHQNRAIIEMTDSPQRITGLAGTGKTIVLAGKAAYLHAAYPELDIAVTFYSKTLYQQYITLITRMHYNHAQEEPNWNKLHILHAWGGNNVPGLYTKVATANGIQPLNYTEAKNRYGSNLVWESVCDELLKSLKNPVELYDVILIDEAQDMPRSFFEICYLSTKPPKKVVWAYDELQRLSEGSILPGPEILFGKNSNGESRFKFKETLEGPADDIILNVCYRNPNEIITTAHSLGLAVYHPDGPIQMYDNQDLWNRIGYNVKGSFKAGETIELERKPDSNPKFLAEYLRGTEIIKMEKCDSLDDQSKKVAKSITEDIKKNELKESDILIISLGPVWDLANQTAQIRTLLDDENIESHIAGTLTIDTYFKDGSVAISQIYRAKGNEAPIVYLINADECATGKELIVKRNRLFTAMTRARGWLRVYGVGDRMDQIINEFNEVKKNNYKLKFVFPSDLETRRKLHGELPTHERAKRDKHLQDIQKLLVSFSKGDIDPDDLTTEMKENFLRILGRKTDKK